MPEPSADKTIVYDTINIHRWSAITGKGWDKVEYSIVGDPRGRQILTIQDYPDNFLMRDMRVLICDKIKEVLDGDPDVYIQIAIHAPFQLLLRLYEFDGVALSDIDVAVDIEPYVDALIESMKGNKYEPELTVDPTTLALGGEASGSITISNTGGETLIWQLTAQNSCITASDNSGVLPQGGSQTIGLTIDRTNLTPGEKSANVTVHSNAGDEVVTVSVVIAAAVAEVSPASLSFAAEEVEKILTISNSGEGNMNWAATPDHAAISCDPANGTGLQQNQSTAITVVINRTGVPPGTYDRNINFATTGGNLDIPCQIVVG